MDKQTISAKIPRSLYNTIQESEYSITESVENGLNLFFNNTENQEQTADNNMLMLQERILNLEGQLKREQDRYDAYFIQMQDLINQKAIEAPGQIKRWWEFWR